jgi:hypothetical protein
MTDIALGSIEELNVKVLATVYAFQAIATILHGTHQQSPQRCG